MVSSAVTSRSTWRSASLTSISTSALVAAGACASPSPSPRAPEARPASLVLVGGDLITMDPARPRATALAVRDGRIVAVGDDADVRGWIAPGTRVVELHGRAVTPGLVDGHCHLYGLGTSLEIVDLRGTASAAEAAARAAEAGRGRAAGEWITGRGWDQNRWPGQAFPTRDVLDAAVGDRPVALRRVDGHAVWVSSAALRLAGIDAATQDPPGGRILRDAAGAPTGVLVDNAMQLVEQEIPVPDRAVRERRIRAAAAHVAALGLTGVHEMGIDPETAEIYRDLAAARALPVRVTAYLSADAFVELPAGQAPTILDDGDDRFSLRGVKVYADGALGSRGAALAADYSDEPGNRGNWVTAPDDLRRTIDAAVAGGWQVAVHAIGDAAVHAVLDDYQAALAAHPGDRRLRVEHAQVVAAGDVPRFAGLGVLASMQPTHATSDMPWAEARVGPERIRGAYAWRTLLDAGARLVAGSDFPVEEPSPLLGLYAAVTRQDRAGNPPGGWYPAQRMTLDEAIAAFTVAPAYAAFVEDARGRLAVGDVADATVYDRPLAPGRGLLETRIDMTLLDGQVVYERTE